MIEDISWISRTINDPTSVDEALVCRESIVVEQIVAVLDAVILGQKAASEFLVKRLGSYHLFRKASILPPVQGIRPPRYALPATTTNLARILPSGVCTTGCSPRSTRIAGEFS